jgi:hypothetical protein
MPITPISSSDIIYRNEMRMLYAHRILKEQSFAQGNTNRIDLVSGNAGVNSSSAIQPMKVGAYFMTPEETAIILGESQPAPAPAPAPPIFIPTPVSSYLPTSGTVSTWTDTAGLNATMIGSPTYTSLGYSFDGTTQYGRIASSTGINNFDNTDSYSVELWFNPSSGQPNPGFGATVLEKWNSTNQSRYPYVFRYNESSTSLILAVFDGANNPGVSISAIPTNTWVQVVGVFNFTTDIMTGYKNGATTSTASLVGVGPVSNTSVLAIAHRTGINGTTPEFMYKGSIGLIRFYNTALSGAQVSQLFTNTRSTFGI